MSLVRVLCPRHEEKTPSAVVYDTHLFCYAGCGRIPLSELGADVVNGLRRSAPLPPEDLHAELARIDGLPRACVRGLSLPVDSTGYYIRWPNEPYYKHRLFFPGDKGKYRCPRGHAKPLFIARPRGAALVVVEGELNALSIASVTEELAVCSPGGVGDFNERTIDKNWSFFSLFKRFVVVVDGDRPGLEAAKKMKTALLKLSFNVRVELMERDANDLLADKKLQDVVCDWKKA